MREVKRKAKVGEYIKIVDKYGNDKSYKNGDILKIVDDCLTGCWVETPTDNHVAIFDKEYVVLEDYNPTEFHVGDRIQIKSWEEMEKEFGKSWAGDINCECTFEKNMKHLCGRKATIKLMNDEEIELTDWSDTSGDMRWAFSTDMMKKVDEEMEFNLDFDFDFGDKVISRLIYTDDLQKDYSIKEEKEMNKVLELYEKRKENEIREELERKVHEECESIEIVKKYRELVEKFEKDMETLYTSEDNNNNQYMLKLFDRGEICRKYILNDTTEHDIRMKYCKETEEKLKKLHELAEEVEAQLSLSNDLDYQREVLKTYGIIDKKTNKVVD